MRHIIGGSWYWRSTNISYRGNNACRRLITGVDVSHVTHCHTPWPRDDITTLVVIRYQAIVTPYRTYYHAIIASRWRGRIYWQVDNGHVTTERWWFAGSTRIRRCYIIAIGTSRCLNIAWRLRRRSYVINTLVSNGKSCECRLVGHEDMPTVTGTLVMRIRHYTGVIEPVIGARRRVNCRRTHGGARSNDIDEYH